MSMQAAGTRVVTGSGFAVVLGLLMVALGVAMPKDDPAKPPTTTNDFAAVSSASRN